MRIDVITLFPDMFTGFKEYGVISKAIKQQLLTVNLWNPRDFTTDKHRTVDERPYGGGPGMLMMYQPLRDTIFAIKKEVGTQTKVIYLSPQGRVFSQRTAVSLAQTDNMILLCGRYEGVDERVIETLVDIELSIGDYVLTGGELAAMTVIDATARLLPNVLGEVNSALQDSFSQGLLDYPQYTKPVDIDNLSVPKVVLSGNHESIKRWRLQQALGQTWKKRPDLLNNLALTKKEIELLNEFIQTTTDKDNGF